MLVGADHTSLFGNDDMMTSIYRRAAAVMACVALLVLSGCNTFTTREPMGDRMELSDKRSMRAIANFDELMGHVWVSTDEKNQPAPFKFVRQDVAGFTASYLDSSSGPVFQGFARWWDDRLILHVGCVNQKLQRPMLMFLMLKVAKNKEGVWMAQGYAPRASAFKQERTTKKGEKVKLEFYESGDDSQLWIKSDEATLAKFFSTCKPDDLFESGGEPWRGMTAEEYRASKVKAGAPSGVRVE
jgi:hypothetical protein